MSRLILLTVAVLVFVWLLRRALAGRKSHRGPGRAGRPDVPPPELVACAHCGVHLPKNEAVPSRDPDAVAPGPYFCSEDHMRRGPG
jgi:uncharacterized protein